MGKIQKCPPHAKSAFLELCCLYWINETNVTIEDAIIECDEDNYKILISKKIIKEENGFIKILFLDEQFYNALEKSIKARESVQKRWEKRNSKLSSKNTTVLHSNYDSNTEEKRREEKEKNILPNGSCDLSSKKSPKKEIEKMDFDGLLNYHNKMFNRSGTVVNDGVRRKYNARLKQGYAKENIIKAMEVAKKQKHHIDNGFKYLTLEFFSRAETLDKYGTLNDNSKSQTSVPYNPRNPDR